MGRETLPATSLKWDITKSWDNTKLATHADLRKRHHCPARRRTAHRKRRTECGEDQHPLHLRQYFPRILRVGKNAIILHAPVRVHVSLNHQRVRVDRVQSHAKRALLQLRRGVD